MKATESKHTLILTVKVKVVFHSSVSRFAAYKDHSFPWHEKQRSLLLSFISITILRLFQLLFCLSLVSSFGLVNRGIRHFFEFKCCFSFGIPHVLCVDTCLLYTSPSPRDQA
eukprot:TRINITY_DN308_c0_g1_i1.p1 TRINITY_DN308_c0_g1~~TRINITY_DN308_c0_g1_i1.p1  ORF type:complete len:112 (-),score=1.93 TRINITY_DN308_c0_g1_i1:72-407(-)